MALPLFASAESLRGDVDGDGYVNVKDVSALINYLLTGEWPGSSVPAYECVDLGLSSGTLWATCNVGANAPEEYGDYFAWGETVPNKENYSWTTTAWVYYEGSSLRFSKYNTSDQYGNGSHKYGTYYNYCAYDSFMIRKG